MIRLKYNGRVELKHAFPPLLTVFPWWERLKEYEIVIPIPLSKARFRERGYNQVDMIFRKWVETSGKTYIPHGMVRMRNTETQSLLTKEERYKNMRGVFHVNKGTSVKGKKILLADDIYTTGATMESAAHELMRAGAEKVVGITIASGAL